MKDINEEANKAFGKFLETIPKSIALDTVKMEIIRPFFISGYMDGLKQGIREAAKVIKEDMENTLLALDDIKAPWGTN